LNSTGERVLVIGFEENNVENRVDFHRVRKLQAIALQADSFENGERAQTFPIQFLGRALGADMSRVKPYLVTNVKFNTFVVCVVVTGLVVLCSFDILDKGVVKAVDLFSQLLGSWNIGWDQSGGRSEIDIEPWVMSVVCVEG